MVCTFFKFCLHIEKKDVSINVCPHFVFITFIDILMLCIMKTKRNWTMCSEVCTNLDTNTIIFLMMKKRTSNERESEKWMSNDCAYLFIFYVFRSRRIQFIKKIYRVFLSNGLSNKKKHQKCGLTQMIHLQHNV